MPELPTHHHITRATVACYIDFAHIGTPRWLCLQDQGDTVVDAIDVRARLHPRKSKAKIAEIVGERLRGLGNFIGVIGLAGSNRHQRLELVVFAQKITFELDTTHDKALTFGDVDRDGNIRFIRQNRHLR